MQIEKKRIKTEDSNDGIAAYRIRNNSQIHLKQLNNKDNQLKEKQQKTFNSVSISQDGLNQLIQQKQQNQESLRMSHHEKVSSLLKKINGDDTTSSSQIRQSVSSNSIKTKKGIQFREAMSSRTQQTLQNDIGLQNITLNTSNKNHLDRSLHQKQPTEYLINFQPKSNNNNNNQIKSSQNNYIKIPFNNMDAYQIKYNQTQKPTSIDNIQLQKLETQESKKYKGIPIDENILLNQNKQNSEGSQIKDSQTNRMKQLLEDNLETVHTNNTNNNNNDNYYNINNNLDINDINQLEEGYNDQYQQRQSNQTDENYKLDNMNNFTTNLTSKSQSINRNMYTSNDSRFKLISELRNKNYFQQNMINELQNEIDEVDEFKIVLDRYSQSNKSNEDQSQNGNNQEKRIMLLKAQLSKQQRHIRQLNSLLTSSRKSFQEVLEVCYFLLENANQEKANQNNNYKQQPQQQQNKTNQTSPTKQKNNANPPSNNNNNTNQVSTNKNQVQSQRGSQNNSVEPENQLLPKTEDDMQVFFNQVSQSQAIQQLNSVLVGVEDRRKFVDNFNMAFSKVIQFQYKSEEFKKLFTVKKSKYTQQAEIKFNHPIRMLFDQFQNCFPVHTLFDFLDSNQKQNTQNKLVTIMSLLRKTDRAFKKVRTYQLFKHNPVCFRQAGGQGDITIPNFLLENQKLFADFMQPRGYSRIISLNFDKIMSTEQSLGLLMDKLVNYTAYLQQKGEYSVDVSDIINSLRTGCEDLISLGIVIPNDQGSMGQRIAIIADNEYKKINQDSSQSMDNISFQQQQQQSQQSPQIEWFNYEQNMDIFTEFNEKRGNLSIMFDEFSAAAHVKDHKTCFEQISKISNLLESFKAMFEAKDNIIKLKNFEIAYLRNQQQLQLSDQESIQEFLQSMQSAIHQFLYPMNQKLVTMIASFNSLIDNGKMLEAAQRQNLIFTFKKSAKELLESNKKILANQFQSNQINILSLQQQFQQRVQLTQQRFNRLKSIIQRPTIM